MDTHGIAPDFTGSRSQHVDPEVVRATVPFRIVVKEVADITAGKITNTFYDWSVEFRGERIATRSPWAQNLPRTRKAAIRQARIAIRDWCSFLSRTVSNTR